MLLGLSGRAPKSGQLHKMTIQAHTDLLGCRLFKSWLRLNTIHEHPGRTIGRLRGPVGKDYHEAILIWLPGGHRECPCGLDLSHFGASYIEKPAVLPFG